MEMTQPTSDNWTLSSFFNSLDMTDLLDVQSAFTSSADGVEHYVDNGVDAEDSLFRAPGHEELANHLQNMQNATWVARQFGLDTEDDAAQAHEETEDVAKPPMIKAPTTFGM